ncbi:hypothetical protein NJB93_21330 [Brucella intermedia]|uniref:hypothetical protein n=1 Tax=Brucella intermedia TaxID=94625 RepID=UPI00209B08FA|nr:hypothetical protein [Brucella intermedia]MCO7729090.1 hypothetical protein [Brucella intermedia]
MNKERIRLDLDEFKPVQKKADPEVKATVERVAEESGFKTRHAPEPARKPDIQAPKPDAAPVAKAPAPAPLAEAGSEPRRRGRKRTTNRNTPFAVKLKVETNNLIYDMADELQCTAIAEVLELALGALQKEIEQGIDPRVRAAEQAAGKS